MEQTTFGVAAQILTDNRVYESGDFMRPTDMLQQFKQWNRAESRATNEHHYPEFTGFYDSYLLQMWRDPSRQNAHYIARGDLLTGTIEGAELYDVSELSWHQDLSELPRDQQQELHRQPDMQLLRDFPDLRGRVRLGYKACELYASPDRITLTEDACEQRQVSDLLKLESHIYILKKALGRSALSLKAA